MIRTLDLKSRFAGSGWSYGDADDTTLRRPGLLGMNIFGKY